MQFLQICTSVLALATNAAAARSEQRLDSTSVAGYGSGVAFDEHAATTDHRRIASIKLSGCDPNWHVTGLEIGWREPDRRDGPIDRLATHGTSGGIEHTLLLDHDEYVHTVYIRTWRKKFTKFTHKSYKTRMGFIKFTTNKDKIVQCGVFDGGDPEYTWGGDGKSALLYFSGSAGEAIDSLQGHFIPVADF